MTQNPTPARLVPPGRILRNELEARGWTQRDLARIMGRPESKISPIMSGKKAITPETALELAEALGTSPELWIRLEANYRLRRAQKKRTKSDISRRSALYNVLPIWELQKRGWLTKTDNTMQLEREVLKLLQVSDLKQPPQVVASFRGTPSKEPDDNARAAWVNRLSLRAESLEVGSFSRRKLGQCVEKLRELAAGYGGCAEASRVLSEYGIGLVLLPHLPKTYIDGAALPQRDPPLIGLSLRYDRIDSFWFNLFHELAHIRKGHRGIFLDDQDGEARDSQEKEANHLAAEWLIPEEVWRRFVDRVRPYFSKKRVTQFAQAVRIHPGIVVGRLQHDNEIRYSSLRAFLQPVSPLLCGQIEE